MTHTGIVYGLSDAIYHRQPGLSSTIAKKILRSPAHANHYLKQTQEPKQEFDVGLAVHAKVLGVGAQVDIIPDDVLAVNGATSTKAAREFIEQSRAEGRIPVKAVVGRVVNLMAESVLAHPIARALFEQRGGNPEVSVFARDEEFDIDVRCRFDYLGPIAVDLKTMSGEATAEGFARAVAAYGYDVQKSHYDHTYGLVTGEHPRFLFVVVESAAPYLTAVHVLDEDFTRIGDAKARRARELYATAIHSGEWPGYPTEISIVRPPLYSVIEYQDKFEGVNA